MPNTSFNNYIISVINKFPINANVMFKHNIYTIYGYDITQKTQDGDVANVCLKLCRGHMEMTAQGFEDNLIIKTVSHKLVKLIG